MYLILGLAMYSTCLLWSKRRLEKGKERRSQEEEEKKKIPIVGEGYPGGTTYLEVSPQGKIQYTIPITPNSAFHLRNRMLSKLGAKVIVKKKRTDLQSCSRLIRYTHMNGTQHKKKRQEISGAKQYYI